MRAGRGVPSPLTPGISVLVPAFNEEAAIVERGALVARAALPDVTRSSSSTTARRTGRSHALLEAFDLVPVRLALRDRRRDGNRCARRTSRVDTPTSSSSTRTTAAGPTRSTRACNVARHPYVCVIDADSLLEHDALLKVAKPILDDPESLAATGGDVRIANGCTVEHGRVVERRPSRAAGSRRCRCSSTSGPSSSAASGGARINALCIISGAFGLFQRARSSRRSAATGPKTVGEDFELTLRLHRHMRERDEPTHRVRRRPRLLDGGAGGRSRTLGRQRRRWQRGLGQTLWNSRRMILRAEIPVARAW